ncbi:hypothetical protein EVAR_36508_1 [Eumeta japonica]|uniref:Uncharacterized protein n=1 Tax=Eumeta variegata TaxID=151549 RepID=A0A4C1X990_EUMVA|nr:hypothetical protein EVAR_36508_1 [Eumeta japonica]
MLPKHYLQVGLYNPRFLAKNHDELLLAVMQHALDMITINELWLLPNEEGSAPSLPGFTLHSAPRPRTGCGGQGGGVVFYVRRLIRVRICEHPVCDCRTHVLKFNTATK